MFVGIKEGRIPENRGKAGSSALASVCYSWLGSKIILNKKMCIWQNMAINAFNSCLLRGALELQWAARDGGR